MTTERMLEICRGTMKAANYCFLISQGEGGEIHARLMLPFEPEEDMTVWFGAAANSRKVAELSRDGRATLAFYDNKETAYVTLTGTAHLESDTEKRKKYWTDSWKDFFKNGPLGADYQLIKFVPTRIEVMNFSQNITPEPYGLVPLVLVRKGGSWEHGGND